MSETAIYMWTPHEPAKLYKRYAFDADMRAYIKKYQDKEEIVKAQLSSFMNYKTFKWLIEESTSSGDFKTSNNIILNSTTLRIRTNYLDEIEDGDIVWLKCALFPAGKYFVVINPVEQSVAYFPKMKKTFKHLILKTLDKKNIN